MSNTFDGCNDNTSGVYDPASHTIVRLLFMPPMRAAPIGTTASGRFFLMGGYEYPPDPDGGYDWTCGLTGEPFLTTSVLSYTPTLALQ